MGFERGALGIRTAPLHHYATCWIVVLLWNLSYISLLPSKYPIHPVTAGLPHPRRQQTCSLQSRSGAAMAGGIPASLSLVIWHKRWIWSIAAATFICFHCCGEASTTRLGRPRLHCCGSAPRAFPVETPFFLTEHRHYPRPRHPFLLTLTPACSTKVHLDLCHFLGFF
jgi:hypothetical protein